MAALALALILAASTPARAARARAVVLVSIDDLRLDEARGASFERLRREAVEFTRAEAAATWTLPSHASMLTGLYPSAHGAGMTPDRPISPRAPYLPELLRRAGFRTAGFVQAAYLDAHFGFARGFEEYRCDGRGMLAAGYSRLRRTLPDALAWLSRHKDERLFLFVHSYAVHMHVRLPDTLARTGPFQCPLPIDFRGAYPEPPRATLGEAACRQVRYNYENAVACLDRELAPFLSELDRLLPRESTLLIVTSDHGESLCDGGDPARRSHAGPPVPEQLGVPLFVRFPGGEGAGTRSEDAVSLVDLAPTILAETGVEAPRGLSGAVLSPGGSPGERTLFADGKDWSFARAGGLRLTLRRDASLAAEGAAGSELARVKAELEGHAAQARRTLEADVSTRAPAPASLREALRAAGYQP